MLSRVAPTPSRSHPAAALELGARCLVMGILNVTPDSFADADRFSTRRQPSPRRCAWRPTAPTSSTSAANPRGPAPAPISADEELSRVLPVLEALRGRLEVPISIDTYKADVARAAVDAGAAIVNDVSGLRHDPALASVVADTGAALILMHTRGRRRRCTPRRTMATWSRRSIDELREGLGRATGAGVPARARHRRPGHRVCQTAAHSYGVLARLPELAAALDRPLLVGPSRKSFMREALGGRPAPERDWGTAAAVTAAVLAGAHIVRVHAVAEMVQVVRVAEEIRQAEATIAMTPHSAIAEP